MLHTHDSRLHRNQGMPRRMLNNASKRLDHLNIMWYAVSSQCASDVMLVPGVEVIDVRKPVKLQSLC